MPNLWGRRTSYKDEWPTRVDVACDEEPEHWAQIARELCILNFKLVKCPT
ncbi:uncharacterized protein THITE_154603 [Thermothielavioides terrestris NRRL 8126]|uniref:Uncharacterized protein n=1 Tax=Thermothielavioides terrestris (strain ATCC 38088 / NRRL 8126) TaxID=578455 RepID=G2QWU3_THETT|nr:uncharacterized protein THITE_154603 [Thermothielavioides terrestris NRRL 8126]AEO63107.1 hypothetical protein THITE_154603 [Thermothielavioides terrestris NRRL 8126]